VTSRRRLIGSIITRLLAIVWQLAATITRSDSAVAADVESTGLAYAQGAQYLDPTLFAADSDYYSWTNIFLNANDLPP